MHRDILEFLIKQLTFFASLIYRSNKKKTRHSSNTPVFFLFEIRCRSVSCQMCQLQRHQNCIQRCIDESCVRMP